MLTQDDERDEDRDEEEEDADHSDEQDSDDQEEDESGDDNEDEDSDDSDDDEDSDEDDDKPVTRKELRDMLRKNSNNRNANRRVHSKDRNDRNSGKDRDRRFSSQSPKTEERLSSVEKFQKRSELLEKKRDFGYENNLSPAQVDFVFRNTKRPTKKFLESPAIKAGLDAIAAQSNVRNNTPSSGGRGSFKSSSGKTWEKMDEREKQDNFADRRRAILSNKRG